MTTLLAVIIILVAVLLAAIVFIQNPKGGGLTNDLGAAAQMGGVKQTNDFVEKATYVLAAILIISCIAFVKIDPRQSPRVKNQTEKNDGQGGPGQKSGQNQGQQKGK